MFSEDNRTSNNSLFISNTSTFKELPKDRLFKRFNKLSNSSSLGLGLSICYKICTNYGFNLSYYYENPYHTFRVDF